MCLALWCVTRGWPCLLPPEANTGEKGGGDKIEKD